MPLSAPDNLRRTGLMARISAVPPQLVLLIVALAGVGFGALYSAAGGHWDPWARAQSIRFVVGFFGMLAVAVTDLKWVYRLAYPFWFLCVALLVFVEVAGVIGMGAQPGGCFVLALEVCVAEDLKACVIVRSQDRFAEKVHGVRREMGRDIADPQPPLGFSAVGKRG